MNTEYIIDTTRLQTEFGIKGCVGIRGMALRTHILVIHVLIRGSEKGMKQGSREETGSNGQSKGRKKRQKFERGKKTKHLTKFIRILHIYTSIHIFPPFFSSTHRLSRKCWQMKIAKKLI